MSELRILVVDDHPIVRHGLRTLLDAREGWRVCGEAGTGLAALQRTERLKPGIVLLDLSLPDMHGLDVIPKIVEVRPQAAVLVVAEYESRTVASEALASGARGLALKSDALRELVRGVQALARGRAFRSPKARELIETKPGGGADANLTSREQQILKLLAEGRTNKEAAAALGVSVRTAEAHRASLMRKLSLGSRSDLIYFALRHQIVRL